MWKIIWATLSLLVVSSSLAQQDPDDPGIQDSIIVLDAYYNQSMRSVTVQLLAVTDEPVVYYNLPLRWNSETILAEGSPVQYHYIQGWEFLYDTAFTDQRFIRMRGQTDTAWLNTSGDRLNVWDIQLQVYSAPPQIVEIDTTYDPLYGSLVFRRLGNPNDITPAFVAGNIYYLLQDGLNEAGHAPGNFELSQNYPNPFNAQTRISYSLSQAGPITLSIYNIMGQKVATLVDGMQKAGEHKVVWDAKDVTSGVYLARLEERNKSQTKRIILIK